MQAWRRHVVAIAAAAGTLALVLASPLVSAAPKHEGNHVAPQPEAAPAQATVTPGHIVVRGRIFYIDRNSERSHTAAGLRVEVFDKDETAFGAFELLDTTTTDEGGFFESNEIPNADPDGASGQLEGTQDVFLKIYTDNGTVAVYETGKLEAFSWTSYQIDPDDGLQRNVPDGVVPLPPLYVMENTRDVEALWTYVNLVEGWNYMAQATGGDPGKVTAYWSSASLEGPLYDPATKSIKLRDGDGGYADIVVQQEAYALLHNAYGDLPVDWDGCTAGPTENLKSVGSEACAFVQGFASHYPLAVYGDPTFESLELRALDLDKVSRTAADWSTGDVVAGRVAGALWDLNEADEGDEEFDTFNATFADIWEVIATRKPVTMVDWWNGWKAIGKDQCGALRSLHQNTIDYNVPPALGTVPIVTLDEDTTLAVDLADFVDDAECPDEDLVFTIVDEGADEAGIRLLPTSVISITPEANWFGSTSVDIIVSDGPASIPFTLQVNVQSVNDCPEISPRIEQHQVEYGDTIVLELLRHGRDVEDTPFDLMWDVVLEEQDAKDIQVKGRKTLKLEFELVAEVSTARNVRALITAEDRDGCIISQPVFLSWTALPNQAPIVWWDRLTREYTALKNTDIMVDLRDVATDREDRPEDMQWRVVNELDNASWGYEDPSNKQILRFHPHPDFLGTEVADLRVYDTTGAVSPPPPATAAITLTWVSQEVYDNLPPYILKNKLRGKTVGVGSQACYDLLDKGDDPDHAQSMLSWFVVGADAADVTVEGQGGHRLCIEPSAQRAGYEGCFTHEFVVQDPLHAESDPYPVRTCWRTIRIFFPQVVRPRR